LQMVWLLAVEEGIGGVGTVEWGVSYAIDVFHIYGEVESFIAL